MRQTSAILAALLTAALVVAACTAADEEAVDADFDDAGMPEEPADVEPVPSDGDVAEPVEPGEPVRPTTATLGRTVIRTATIDLQVPDPSETVDEVTRIAENAGGFVATADLRRDRQGVLSGTVTIRVPSEELLATLDRLDELAEGPASRRIDEQDVTIEAADLDARLANLTTYERELTELLGDVRQTTAEPDDLLRIFERIREVRSEIDVLQGRLAVLSDQVSLSTITVNITPAAQAVPVSDPGWRPGDTAREAVTSLTRTLGSLANAAIWFGLAVLPVIALVGLPFVLVGLLWWRRRGGSPTAVPPPDAPTSPTSPPG